MWYLLLQIALLSGSTASLQAFTPISQQNDCQQRATTISCRMAAGQGFGKPPDGASAPRPKKTYGKDSATSRDVIDMESSMKDFFAARPDWLPLFQSLAVNEACPAIDHLGGAVQDVAALDFHEESTPWRRLQAIPNNDDDRIILANFLDAAQRSLIEIPVDEQTQEDDLDLQFVEEGRRILALGRFHVMRENRGGSVDHMDALFEACWNEVMHLALEAEEHTGSLIILPQYESLSDLRRFTDMNVLQPLEWLGLGGDFEVSSFQRGSPAIRLIYKLSGIPDPSEKGTPEEDTADKEE